MADEKKKNEKLAPGAMVDLMQGLLNGTARSREMSKEKPYMPLPTEEQKKVTPDKVLEDVKKNFPWYRLEDRPGVMYRYRYEDFHPQYYFAAYRKANEQYARWVNPHSTKAELQAERDKIQTMQIASFKKRNEMHPEWETYGYWETYDDIPGCPEEPDAPKNHVLVRRIREDYRKGPHPVLFIPSAGGLYFTAPEASASAPVAHYFGCDLVVSSWRSYADAEYPAGLNDFHASYQWMIDHAKELNIDTNRIVIGGASGSGMMSAALAFRLKRYNWCGGPTPRGIVIQDGLWDDMETNRGAKVLGTASYSQFLRGMWQRYLGENFASAFIGPEGVPNHASVDECRGLPPFAIYAGQDFPQSDKAMEFAMKLNAAGVYCSFQMLGGVCHGNGMRDDHELYDPFSNSLAVSEYQPRPGIDHSAVHEHFIFGAIQDFFDYDFRR